MHDESTFAEMEKQPPGLQTPRQRRYCAAATASIIGFALAVLLYLLSRANYPLFHSIVDTVTVFIAGSVFVVVWNGRRHLDNNYYLLIAIAFLAFALLDFMHIVGNKGMGVLPEYSNLGPTFYIASRYVLGFSFLLAPLFIKRQVSTVAVFAVYLLVVVLVLLSVLHWRNFPATFIEGTGLTTFKVYSDYAVCLMLLGGLGLLLLNRQAFDARVLKLIALSLVLSIATGLAFTLYADPFGIANAVGHFFQIASFSLIYLGFVETALSKPQTILFRNLKQSNETVLGLNADLLAANQQLASSHASALNLMEDADLARQQAERAAAALRESEQRIQQALRVSRSFTFDWEPQTDRVRRSDSCGEILGLTGDEAVNDISQQYFQRIHPDDRARFVQMLGTLTPATGDYTTEYRIQCPGEREVVLEEVGHGYFDATGRLTRLVGVTTDITARNRAEEALRAAKDELEQRVRERTAELSHSVAALQEEVDRRTVAERILHQRSEQLRALASELTLTEQRERRRLAEVLHDDLQQLLVGAKFRLALLHHSADPPVRQAAEGVQELLDQSIECSRTLTGELSPPILHQAGLVAGLEWLAVWMQQKHGLNVELQTQETAATPESEDMRVLLFQSVRELLFNAVKHAKARTAQVRLRRLDDHVEVTISDNGAGFDPQQAIAGEGKTGGFGLFSIRERLDLLGGKLEIDSAPGRGSRFTLRAPLPSAAPPTEPPLPATLAGVQISRTGPGVAAASTRHRIRVLLVDDHVVVRQGLSHLLREEADIEIVGEASDGQTAVDMVRQYLPDVVTMDISMPGMDGIETTKIIHAEFPAVRVIGLSMFAEPAQAEKMRQAGAVNYLTKSGPSDALVAAIRACVPAGPDARSPRPPDQGAEL